MGTIADKLTYLSGTKTAIKDAIVAKGVTVADSDTFRSYATKISDISGGGGVSKKKYGVSIDNILGNVDELGTYVVPTEPFTPDFSNVKHLPAGALYYKFYNNTYVTGDIVFGFERILGSGAMQDAFSACFNITSVSFPALTAIGGTSAMNAAFSACSSLTSISFPQLTTIGDGYVMRNAFSKCPDLASVSFPQLTTISGSNALAYAFSDCSAITSVSLPALATISGDYAISNAFNGCASLTSISFPALKEILPETTQNQFTALFNRCTALTEIHFPAAMQARVEQLTGYGSKFGATNATIYFDL